MRDILVAHGIEYKIRLYPEDQRLIEYPRRKCIVKYRMLLSRILFSLSTSVSLYIYARYTMVFRYRAIGSQSEIRVDLRRSERDAPMNNVCFLPAFAHFPEAPSRSAFLVILEEKRWSE